MGGFEKSGEQTADIRRVLTKFNLDLSVWDRLKVFFGASIDFDIVYDINVYRDSSNTFKFTIDKITTKAYVWNFKTPPVEIKAGETQRLVPEDLTAATDDVKSKVGD